MYKPIILNKVKNLNTTINGIINNRLNNTTTMIINKYRYKTIKYMK